MGKDGDAVSAVQTFTVGPRAAAMGYYVYDNYPGFLMINQLSDGSLGGIEAVGNQGASDILGEKTALAIAQSLDVMAGATYEMNVGDPNNAWLDAINELAPGSN